MSNISRSTVIATAVDAIQEQLDTLQNRLAELMEAKSNETKSSAGDKYETGMAMIQNQEQLLKKQYADTRQRMMQLQAAANYSFTARVKKGSLVQLSTGWFFLATALGKITVNQTDVYVLSTDSPLGKKILKQTINSQITLNGTMIRVLDIQ